jgi:rubrerythrin
MEKISKQVEDAIKGAIQLEIDGKAFFNHAADITTHEKGRKMFQWLAQEEVRHLETFGKMFTTILEDADWKKYVDSMSGRGEAPLIKKLKENMKRESSKGEIEAIRVGMELEREAIDFFQKAAGETDDPTARKIFLQIAEEEKFHYDLLEAQHDSVSQSGFWLGSAEFRMDGKW